VQSEPDVPVNPHDVLTGISLTLPDGTVVSIRRGSAEAVVSFLKLYTGEASPCSD
jgi:ABC-type histidine transport system ATPase subunit